MKNNYEFVDKIRYIMEAAQSIYLSALQDSYDSDEPVFALYNDIGMRVFDAINQSIDEMEEEISDSNSTESNITFENLNLEQELDKGFGNISKENKIGFWTDHETDNGHDVYHCSICDYESIPYKICPSCGAKMKDR